MRIRYKGRYDPHQNVIASPYKAVPARLCVLFEEAPRPRLLKIYVGYDLYRPRPVPMPWVYHLIAYEETVVGGETRFVYPGYYQLSYRVLLSDRRLGDLGRPLYHSPFDSSGYPCLPHHWDGYTFTTREELFGSVINAWYSCSHVGDIRKKSGSVKLSSHLTGGVLIDEPAGSLPIKQ